MHKFILKTLHLIGMTELSDKQVNDWTADLNIKNSVLNFLGTLILGAGCTFLLAVGVIVHYLFQEDF